MSCRETRRARIEELFRVYEDEIDQLKDENSRIQSNYEQSRSVVDSLKVSIQLIQNENQSLRQEIGKKSPAKFGRYLVESHTKEIQRLQQENHQLKEAQKNRENYIRRIEEENRILKEDLPRDQNRNYKRKNHSCSEDSAKLDFVGDTQASYDSGITLNSDFENHKEPQISNFLDQKSCSNPLDGLFCQEQLRPGSSNHDISFVELDHEVAQETQPFEQASFYFSSHVPQTNLGQSNLRHSSDSYLLSQIPEPKNENVFHNVSVDSPNPIPNIRTRPLNTSHHENNFQSGTGRLFQIGEGPLSSLKCLSPPDPTSSLQPLRRITSPPPIHFENEKSTSNLALPWRSQKPVKAEPRVGQIDQPVLKSEPAQQTSRFNSPRKSTQVNILRRRKTILNTRPSPVSIKTTQSSAQTSRSRRKQKI